MTETEAAEILAEVLGPHWNLADVAKALEDLGYFRARCALMDEEYRELRHFRAEVLRSWGVPT